MDKNTVIGFVLIGIVLMVWLWMTAPPPQTQVQDKDTTGNLNHQKTKEPLEPNTTSKPGTVQTSISVEDTLGKYFSHLIKKEKKKIIVETDCYKLELSSVGGTVTSWTLKDYLTWDRHPIDLLTQNNTGDFHLLFSTSDGKIISTKYLQFEPKNNTNNFKITDEDSLKLEMQLNVTPSSKIIKTLIFYGNRYSVDISYKFQGMESIIANYAYQVVWETGIRNAEHNSVDESNFAQAYALAGGELSEIDATNFNETVKDSNISGRVNWIAMRNKYFAVAVIPRMKESKRAYLEGTRTHLPDEGAAEKYFMAMEMPFGGNAFEEDRYTIFAGPLNFEVVKKYNIELDRIMSLGAVWLIRPISEYAIIPLFKFLKMFIPNFGIILIIFSLIVKVVLHPLTKTSMKSMQKMQSLQPMMEEIREKYKDDPQKMNQQVMRLYKEYGVNPAGGCLPMLLQLPILYALWAVFSSAIELRQASFVLWISDLSIPDMIMRLPFRIPIFNINEISGLALLMGITMFVQQKMSVKDPRQKMMVWMMPILLTLMFNSFPAGLNLYYFVFNLLSIGQQAWVNKKHKNEPLRKVEPKKSTGWISRLAKDLPMKQKK
ncbi:MAG: membrane protein insertase YidC [Ignavibacteriales bacterium]|nr:membrane protein insertase YidC [Ignavibacteriales bacterium]